MQKNNLIKAVNKNVRSSPRKISLVLDHIRGKKVDTVLRDLDFIRKRVLINKIEIVINSAPKNNLGIKPKDLSSNHANIHCISNISPKIKKGEANIKKKLKGL